MSTPLHFSVQVDRSQEGTYFTVPFHVPEGVASIALEYGYDRRPEQAQAIQNGVFTGREEVNIIDLGLIDPRGEQVGVSGSDKTEIFVGETQATPGYRPSPIMPGEWRILVGAYKVAPEGVRVDYQVTLVPKARRLLRGDLHAHTVGSDGVHALEELAWKAKRNGLDFVVVTDHNQFVSADAMPRVPGVTMIPGVEWTHFRGHAGMLGVEKPYDGGFACNTLEEVRARFEQARQRGALVVINHPFAPGTSFEFGLDAVPWDCLEVWNGPMRESNLRAVAAWHQLLRNGAQIPACGGSDYHRDMPFIFLGGPTMCVYAGSAGASDILAALRAGHGFITFAPGGPALELAAGDAIMGDTVDWQELQEVQIRAQGLLAGDVLRIATGQEPKVVFTAPSDGDVSLAHKLAAPGFVRVEILRSFLPGLPMLPALLSNPLYFLPPVV